MMAVSGCLRSFYAMTIWIWKSDKNKNVNEFRLVGKCFILIFQKLKFLLSLCVLFENCTFAVYNAVM